MRKTKTIIIDDGRDKGKKFLITEPDAFTAEKLVASILALCDGDLSAEMLLFKSATPQGEILWDGLLKHAKFTPNPNNPEITRDIESSDIEDYKTLIKVKSEVLNLILGF